MKLQQWASIFSSCLVAAVVLGAASSVSAEMLRPVGVPAGAVEVTIDEPSFEEGTWGTPSEAWTSGLLPDNGYNDPANKPQNFGWSRDWEFVPTDGTKVGYTQSDHGGFSQLLEAQVIPGAEYYVDFYISDNPNWGNGDNPNGQVDPHYAVDVLAGDEVIFEAIDPVLISEQGATANVFQSFIAPQDASGALTLRLYSVLPDGYSVTSTGFDAVQMYVNPVPEPSTVALLLCGLVSIVLIRRRRS